MFQVVRVSYSIVFSADAVYEGFCPVVTKSLCNSKHEDRHTRFDRGCNLVVHWVRRSCFDEPDDQISVSNFLEVCVFNVLGASRCVFENPRDDERRTLKNLINGLERAHFVSS